VNRIGTYIYGIINSNSERSLDPCGITSCEGVYTISYQDISAVVSDSEIVDYAHLLKDALARSLIKHQMVIERVMNLEYEIIPVRLGTFALDGNEVRCILTKGYPTIKKILNETKDKIEIDIVATWSDFNLVLKEVGEETELKEFKEKLLANSKGVTVEDRIKVGAMVKKVLDGKREKFAFQIQNALNTVCDGFKVHELMDDNMILNVAFLINKANSEDFYRKVEELNTKFAEKLNFRCVGPLPAYSFYTLKIKKMLFEEINWARKKLGINNVTTSKDEIKKAFQKSALSSHPDRNPDTPGIEKEFNDVTKAHKVLVDYSLAAQQSGQQGSFSFNEEEFKKNAILVKL